jgi:hypothetical protein
VIGSREGQRPRGSLTPRQSAVVLAHLALLGVLGGAIILWLLEPGIDRGVLALPLGLWLLFGVALALWLDGRETLLFAVALLGTATMLGPALVMTLVAMTGGVAPLDLAYPWLPTVLFAVVLRGANEPPETGRPQRAR